MNRLRRKGRLAVHLTPREMATWTGATLQSVYRWIERGMPSVLVRGYGGVPRPMIPAVDARKWLEGIYRHVGPLPRSFPEKS